MASCEVRRRMKPGDRNQRALVFAFVMTGMGLIVVATQPFQGWTSGAALPRGDSPRLVLPWALLRYPFGIGRMGSSHC